MFEGKQFDDLPGAAKNDGAHLVRKQVHVPVDHIRAMDGLRRMGGMANIVVVEFSLLEQDEPVSFVEPIRVTLPKCADMHRAGKPICLGEDFRQHDGAHTLTLVAGSDVEVIQEQCTFLELDDEESNLLARHENVPGRVR